MFLITTIIIMSKKWLVTRLVIVIAISNVMVYIISLSDFDTTSL